MKRFPAFVFALICALGLTSCGGHTDTDVPDQPDSIASAPAEEAEQVVDRIPMVKVGGELYLDTGKESTAAGRCGTMDGEITSAVDESECPTEDGQSNFGTGISYQYGETEGTVELYMNGKWWVFAKETAEKRP